MVLSFLDIDTYAPYRTQVDAKISKSIFQMGYFLF